MNRSRLSTACLATNALTLPAQSPRKLFKLSQTKRGTASLPKELNSRDETATIARYRKNRPAIRNLAALQLVQEPGISQRGLRRRGR